MIQDSLLEFSPQWSAIANEGIGGPVPYVAPKVFTASPATQANPFLEVTISGSSYTDMMAFVHRPLMPVFSPNAIYYSFNFDIMPDANQSVIQALEFEASFSDSGGYYYNNSMEYNNVNPKGHLQAYASPTNVWADTGIVLPMFPAKEWTEVKVNYLVDTVAHVLSTLSVEIAGKVYPLPAMFQRVPGTKRNWAPGIYTQFQSDLASKGGAFTNKFANISIDWL